MPMLCCASRPCAAPIPLVGRPPGEVVARQRGPRVAPSGSRWIPRLLRHRACAGVVLRAVRASSTRAAKCGWPHAISASLPAQSPPDSAPCWGRDAPRTRLGQDGGRSRHVARSWRSSTRSSRSRSTPWRGELSTVLSRVRELGICRAGVSRPAQPVAGVARTTRSSVDLPLLAADRTRRAHAENVSGVAIARGPHGGGPIRGDCAGASDVDAASRTSRRVWSSHARSRTTAAQARCLNKPRDHREPGGDPGPRWRATYLALAAYQQAGLVRGMAETQHNIGISLVPGRLPRALARRGSGCGWRSGGGRGRWVRSRPRGDVLSCTWCSEDVELAAVELGRAAAPTSAATPVGLAEVVAAEAGVARRGRQRRRGDALGRAAELARGQEALTAARIERDLSPPWRRSVMLRSARRPASGRRAVPRLGRHRCGREIAALIK